METDCKSPERQAKHQLIQRGINELDINVSKLEKFLDKLKGEPSEKKETVSPHPSLVQFLTNTPEEIAKLNERIATCVKCLEEILL